MAKKSYIDELIEGVAENTGVPVKEVAQEFEKRSDATVNLNFPGQEHRWVDRGLVLSCEGASHPNHRSFKRQR